VTSKSVSEILTEQFYAWELRGRGIEVWPEPVVLEPAFRPFPGHFVPYRPIVDDGRRPTFLSQLTDQFLGRPAAPALPAAPFREELPEPEARQMDSDDVLLAFDLHLPAEEVVRPELLHGVLGALRVTSYPVAWELVGTGEGIHLQLVLRHADAALVKSTLSSAFPRLGFAPAPDRLQDFAFENDEYTFAILELTLAREFMVPLPVPKSFDPDPLIGLIAAMEDLGQEEFAAVQVLFQGAVSPWAESIYRAITNEDGNDFFFNAPEIAALGKKKALQPLCGVAIRLVMAAPDEYPIERRFPRFAAAFHHYAGPDRNSLVPIMEARQHRESDVVYRRSHRSGMLLGVDELATLVHPPSASIRSPRLLSRVRRATRALPVRPTSGILIGENRHAGEAAKIMLSDADLRRHVHVIGASGSGKSNFLLHALRNAVDAGYGLALIDPHGDLADDFLALLPDARRGDLVLLDAADPDSPVGLNVLAAPTDLERTLLGSDLVAVFRRLSTSWGDQMHAVFANAIQAFLESPRGGTLADLRRFLVEDEYRREYLTTVEDEHVVYYWRREFPLLKGRPESPILTRLEGFLRAKLVRRIVAGGRADLDFRSMMDEGGIFIAKLAHGAIGEENAALLGSFLVAKLHQVALSRQASRDRRTFLVAIDEFQHFVTPSMATLLSGARKFGLGLVLVHQDLRQVESRDREVAAALLANAGTRIVFRTSDTDARALAEGFAHFAAEDIRTLPVGHAIARIGGADRDFNLESPLVSPAEHRAAEVPPPTRFLIAASPSTALADTPAEPKATPKIVRSEPPPPPAPTRRERKESPLLGRGGPQHKYLQNVLKSFGETHGYHATVEKQVDGGSIDVFLERAGSTVACEISVASTTDYELRNIAKCLRAGAQHVLVVVTEAANRERLYATAHREYAEAREGRVIIVAPEDAISWIAAQGTSPENRVGGYRVRVNYRPPSEADQSNRGAAISEVLARSLRRLRDE
jgi:hypothetical protein